MSDRVPSLVIPLPARENVRAKAIRYLIEGRLTVLTASRNPPRIFAECRGDSAMYHLGYARDDWWCHCDNQGRRCSHILALQMVTLPEEVKP